MPFNPKKTKINAHNSSPFNPQGGLKVAMDSILKASPYPQNIYALGGAINLISILIGTKFMTTDGLFANLYVIAIGETGSGKDAPRSTIKRMAQLLGITEKIIDNVASGPGLEDYLANVEVAEANLLIDELGKALQQRKSSGNDHGVVAILLKMYTSVNSFYTMRTKASDTKPKVLTNPFVSIYGVTTQEALHQGLSESDAESGLLGRFLFLHSTVSRPRSQHPEICGISQAALTVWYEAMKSHKPPFEHQPKVIQAIAVEYSFTAKKDLVSYQQKIDEYLRSDTLNPIARAASVRIIEMVKKLSLLSAVSRSPDNPIITIMDVKWAKSVTNLSRNYVINVLATAIENGEANSPESYRINKCLKIIRNARTYQNKGFLAATKDGYMPKRLLQNKMKVVPQTFAETILALTQSGEICTINLDKAKHGLTGEAYCMPDDPI